jgi:hypothetical protein
LYKYHGAAIKPAREIIMQTCEIFICMNENGEFIVTTDGDEALNELMENFGATISRTVKLTVQMAAPVITEATVTVPDEVGETVSVEA